MKRILASTLILCSFFIGLCTNAETVEQDKGYISVSESVIKEISPNQAEISIGVETFDTSMQKAVDENKIIANKVLSAIKPLLGTNDYLKTGEFSAKPQFIYTKENKKVFDKYVVKNVVLVKTQNTTIVSKIVDTAILQGATNVDDLKFSTTDYDSACNEALAELTKKAYAQATAVASSIGSKIVGIKTINVTCNSNDNPRPYYDMMMAKGVASNTSSTPVESGKLKINITVDASFYVK